MGGNACHSGNARARGPNLAEAYSTRVQLTNGSYAMVDYAFLRDSILNPTMHTTVGYAAIMPTYQGQISEEGLIDLQEERMPWLIIKENIRNSELPVVIQPKFNPPDLTNDRSPRPG